MQTVPKKPKLELISFSKLDRSDLEMICEWRNRPEIRAEMFNTERISLDDHLEFCRGLANRSDCYYFLIRLCDKPCGVIDITGIKGRSCEGGCYFVDGPDYLKTDANLAIYMVYKQLHLEAPRVSVKKTNLKALFFNTMKLGLSVIDEDTEYYYLCCENPVAFWARRDLDLVRINEKYEVIVVI